MQIKSNSEVVLNKLRENSIHYYPNKQITLLSDTSDNKFLELASVSAADYLITGNTLHFTMSEFEYTKIVTPRDYWAKYKP